MPSPDVVIVGGGIIGCASAYFLARAGATVELIEADDIGARQSGQNGGWVRLLGRATAELELMIRSRPIWSELEAELEAPLDWVQAGSIRLAVNDFQLQQLQEWLDSAREFDQGLRMIDGAEVARLIPGLRKGFW